MDSIRTFSDINIRVNNSSLFQKYNSIFKENKKEYDLFKNSRSISQSTDELSEKNSRKDFSNKKIISKKLINIINEDTNPYYFCTIIKKSVEKEVKHKMSNVNKKQLSLLKNGLNNNNNKKKDFTHKLNISDLKPSPPEASSLFDSRYDFSNNIINNKNKVGKKLKISHVFLNHLVLPNKINNHKKDKYITLATKQRTRTKTLTILYYRPLNKE